MDSCDISECDNRDYIKALEHQPSENCVSREAAFETIDDCNSDGLKGIFCSYDDGERFKEYIKKLPPVTPTQRWIPVSKILPKESDGVVLITVDGEVITGRYSEFSNTWYKGDMRGVGGDNPIAWQPLPKPYEEKRGNSDDSN